MELLWDRTLHQRTMNCKVSGYIKNKDLILWPRGFRICTYGFSLESARLLVREQELDSPERLKVLTDMNVDDICKVMRKPGSKSTNGTPDRGQQVSVIAQENLELAVFLFHHWWRCIFDKEVTWVQEETVNLLVGQKRLKDKYKDPGMLP